MLLFWHVLQIHLACGIISLTHSIDLECSLFIMDLQANINPVYKVTLSLEFTIDCCNNYHGYIKK
jgi:hypothetical protein